MAWNARITKEQVQGETVQLAEIYAAILAQAQALDSSLCGIVAFDPTDAATVAGEELAADAAEVGPIDLSSLGLKGRLIFANLAALESLDLSGNDLIDAPDVSMCTALTELDLSSNKLTASALETLLGYLTAAAVEDAEIDISGVGNAVPNEATMALIYALNTDNGAIVTSNEPSFYFSHWPITLDVYELDPDGWTRVKEIMLEMKTLGMTHAGVMVWSYADVSAQFIADYVAELRALDLKFTVTDYGTWLTKTYYQYDYDGGSEGTFSFEETITSGAKEAILFSAIDNGATGTIICDSSAFVNDEVITGTGGKTASINGAYLAKGGLPIHDGANHASNGLDLRYFDTTGWKFNAAAPGCYNHLRDEALDPSYVGTVWTDYVTKQAALLDAFGFANGDFYCNDMEVWNQPARWAKTSPSWCGFGSPVAMVAKSVRCGKSPTSNPTDDETIAFANYNYHWQQRGLDLVDAVKTQAPLSHALLYLEQSQEQFDLNKSAYWPPGTGDFVYPTFYYLDDTDALDALVNDGVSDWTRAMATISFTYSSGGWKSFSSDLSYEAGKIFKAAGFIGFYEYPGWCEAGYDQSFGYLFPGGYESFITHYKAHLAAFLAGFNS